MVKYRILHLARPLGRSGVGKRLPEPAERGPDTDVLHHKRAEVLTLRHPEYYCQALTAAGLQDLGKPEYEGLVRTRGDYGLFIDGMTREVFCTQVSGGVRFTKLTPKEFGLMREYLLAGRPLRPRGTEVGSRCLSDAAAIKLFEKARGKVDVRLGRYQYRAFRLHKDATEQGLKAYEFSPPPSLRYCLILPV
ncbi:MAG: hypothetical protein ACYCRH_03400 [Acidiferrobacteraceae bacterium]